jgi:hypothetical protein
VENIGYDKKYKRKETKGSRKGLKVFENKYFNL